MDKVVKRLAVLAMLFAGLTPAAAAQKDQANIVREDYLVGAWWLYKSAFVDNGRVIDRSNGNISHSEGQGYGMLLAVAANDRDGFEAIWEWTRSELYVRGDDLAAWKWDPNGAPHVSDTNNASDGDLLIAWALLRAGNRWGEKGYTDRAVNIADTLARQAIVTDPVHGVLLLPAAKGFSNSEQADGPVVNLSYWIFPAIEELGTISPEFPAKALIASGTRLLGTARFGTSQMPADWISLKGAYPRPAQKFAPNFGYDAVRIPLYAAWYGHQQPALLAKVYDQWNKNGKNTVQVIELATASPLVAMPDPGYQAVSELLSCSLGKDRGSHVIGAFEPTEYYPSTLHLISIVAISERYPQCLESLN
ncbi:MAG: glycosyl hydrolase 8 family protein [Rhizobium sp.]|nr:glycosyl hydrolase 8 family protein [Rhizobium sp.]